MSLSRIHYQLANDPALVVDQEVFDRADLTIESMQPVTDDSAATSQMRKNRFQFDAPGAGRGEPEHDDIDRRR
jgi:hypothetical protein